MPRIEFTKMSGAGNDFIMIDNRKGNIELSKHDIESLCKRHTGIGADGLITLEHSNEFDFGMNYYNADGKPGSMCGNGGRCITEFAFTKGVLHHNHSYVFEVNSECYESERLGDSLIKLKMRPPQGFKDEFLNEGFKAYFINTGSPHVVIFIDEQNHKHDIETIDVLTLGKQIRSNKEFFPDGTNVNFIQKISEHELRIRTFERGVENETLACGTGCVASAIVSELIAEKAKEAESLSDKGMQHKTTSLRVQSGETVQVEFERKLNAKSEWQIDSVFLIGTAKIVFEGSVEI